MPTTRQIKLKQWSKLPNISCMREVMKYINIDYLCHLTVKSLHSPQDQRIWSSHNNIADPASENQLLFRRQITVINK